MLTFICYAAASIIPTRAEKGESLSQGHTGSGKMGNKLSSTWNTQVSFLSKQVPFRVTPAPLPTQAPLPYSTPSTYIHVRRDLAEPRNGHRITLASGQSTQGLETQLSLGHPGASTFALPRTDVNSDSDKNKYSHSGGALAHFMFSLT